VSCLPLLYLNIVYMAIPFKVRLCLSVWDPYTKENPTQLEQVQRIGLVRVGMSLTAIITPLALVT
jgi:hypothetical protein